MAFGQSCERSVIDAMVIDIRRALHGPGLENSAFDRAITRVQEALRKVNRAHRDIPGPTIRLVYHIPGEFDELDWDELRKGKLDLEKQYLHIDAAIPVEIASDPDPVRHVIEYIDWAITIAFHTFDDLGYDFPLEDAERMIDELRLKCGIEAR